MSAQSLRLSPNLCPSLTEEVYNKLKEENINNGIDLLSRDAEELAAKTRISYKVIQNICKVLNAYHGAFQMTGLELYNEAMKSCFIMSSGLKELDKILEGGLFSEEILEIFGVAGCGKTSLCLRISCHIASVEKGKVIYIDPMHCVNAAFARSILNSCSSPVEEMEDALSNIHLIHPKTIWEVCTLFEELLKEDCSHPVLEDSKNCFVVLDSIPILISALCRGSPFDSFGILNHLGSLLHRFVKKRKVCLVIVNNAVKKQENETTGPSLPSKSFDGSLQNSILSAYKPALGRYWMHFPHTRLLLERNTKDRESKTTVQEEWLIFITKSTRLKPNSCAINLFEPKKENIC
ncbi:UNVERIFIED_CONTAM: hypothetical protein RMT77_014429 [Armadillidium vulgare]